MLNFSAVKAMNYYWLLDWLDMVLVCLRPSKHSRGYCRSRQYYNIPVLQAVQFSISPLSCAMSLRLLGNFHLQARDGVAPVVTQSFAALQSEECRHTISRNAKKTKMHWDYLLHWGPAYWRNHSGSLYAEHYTWASSGIKKVHPNIYIFCFAFPLWWLWIWCYHHLKNAKGTFNCNWLLHLKKNSLYLTHNKSRVPHTQCALAVPLSQDDLTRVTYIPVTARLNYFNSVV